LLILSINLFGQNNQIPSLKGLADSLVVVDINTIKEATIKLNERLYLLNVVSLQNKNIEDYKNIINQQDSYILQLNTNRFELEEKYKNVLDINANISKRLENQRKWITVFGCTTAILVAGIVASLVIH